MNTTASAVFFAIMVASAFGFGLSLGIDYIKARNDANNREDKE